MFHDNFFSTNSVTCPTEMVVVMYTNNNIQASHTSYIQGHLDSLVVKVIPIQALFAVIVTSIPDYSFHTKRHPPLNSDSQGLKCHREDVPLCLTCLPFTYFCLCLVPLF